MPKAIPEVAKAKVKVKAAPADTVPKSPPVKAMPVDKPPSQVQPPQEPPNMIEIQQRHEMANKALQNLWKERESYVTQARDAEAALQRNIAEEVAAGSASLTQHLSDSWIHRRETRRSRSPIP